MRRTAVVLLLGATGCAAAPAEEAVEGPQIAPAAMSASGEEVLTPDDVGGGCGMLGPGGGAAGASAGGEGGDGGGDDVGSSWGGDACRLLCSVVIGVGCDTALTACTLGTVVSVGGLSVPCGIGVVGACLGGVACFAGCPL